MFPSSDPAIPNDVTSSDDIFNPSPTMPSASEDTGYAAEYRTTGEDSMEVMPSYEMAAAKSSPNVEQRPGDASEPAYMSYDEFAPVQPPSRSSKSASYSQLSSSIRPSYPNLRTSQQDTPPRSDPESPIDVYTEGYHGASDISIRRSASSTEADLFSDVEDTDSDNEPSGFEPTETADIPISASGALDPNDEPLPYSSDDEQPQRPSDHDEHDVNGHFGDRYDDFERDRLRTVSLDSYPNANSPTESQLVDEGFEFHNRIPESRQAGQFENEAFREALKDISPDMPRKQQWYAWRKVMEMLDNERPEGEDDDLFDDSELPNDFSLGSLANHNFGGCQCGGDESKCSCAPEHCGCNGCPRKANRHGDQAPCPDITNGNNVEEEPQDVPMNIGYTPITPAFPELQYRQYAPALNQTESDVEGKLPGLGHLNDEDAPAGDNSHKVSIEHTNIENDCGCSCGKACRCPENQCHCAKPETTDIAEIPPETTVEQLFDDPFKRPAAYFHPQETWSDAATAAQSPAPSELREPRSMEPPFPQIATQLSHATVLSPQDAPTPAQGARSPESYAPTPATPSSPPVSRPDTPRPQGDSFEYGIRQSVDREVPSLVSDRESTPAYEDRSGTPSPISHETPSDTSMYDATPTQQAIPVVFEREGSVLPDAPSVEQYLDSPPVSPSFSVPPVPAIPIQHLQHHAPQYSQIPVPPMPTSPTLKPRKQRATSTSTTGGRRNTKSAVHGSKISKAQPKQRNVTRKATGKKVQAAVNRIEDSVRKAEHEDEVEKQRVSSRGSVKNWGVDVKQKNGSPPRRSARLRQRTASPSPLGDR